VSGTDEPWFVSAKDMTRNVLIVVQGHDHPDLLKPSLSATDLTWISGKRPHCNWVYAAKTRYRQADAPCAITCFDSGVLPESILPKTNGPLRRVNRS
jgi:tRNA-specific 2-thiouridylase